MKIEDSELLFSLVVEKYSKIGCLAVLAVVVSLLTCFSWNGFSLESGM
ncbi:MAG: hypothetical protein ACEPOZ_00415 [Marinifilaceae bacterium]